MSVSVAPRKSFGGNIGGHGLGFVMVGLLLICRQFYSERGSSSGNPAHGGVSFIISMSGAPVSLPASIQEADCSGTLATPVPLNPLGHRAQGWRG